MFQVETRMNFGDELPARIGIQREVGEDWRGGNAPWSIARKSVVD